MRNVRMDSERRQQSRGAALYGWFQYAKYENG